ncbi:hypothetical protein [Methylobacterium sp. AMS5]|uniref:hypothetical protein n=1 Tax=Methylobacterium sp. AMS5 TaxID=925818 RepID=UPI00257009B6|nr:hypothetical protein [Methylobacterium sp. AMS5]
MVGDRDAFLQRAPANILVKYRNDAGAVARVKHLLRSQNPDVWLDFDEVAQRFDLSASTLHRRIEAEGSRSRRSRTPSARKLRCTSCGPRT